MEKLNEIIAFLEGLKPDVEKFYVKGVQTAGTRIRVNLQAAKKLIQELRLDIGENKKSKNKIV